VFNTEFAGAARLKIKNMTSNVSAAEEVGAAQWLIDLLLLEQHDIAVAAAAAAVVHMIRRLPQSIICH
jgi:hypothetical protein